MPRFDFGLLERDALARAWSPSELARRAGVTRQVVSKYFTRSSIRPDPVTVEKLAIALGYPLARYMLRATSLAPASNAHQLPGGST